MKDKISIGWNETYRILERHNKVIIGNTITGKWFKCRKEAFELIKSYFNKEITEIDIWKECEDEYTKEYVKKLMQLIGKIGAEAGGSDEGKANHIKDVTMVLTNACNLKCRHCVASCGDRERKDLSFKDIVQIIHWCNQESVESITLTGGEIFVRKDIQKIIEYVGNNFNGRVNILTNGTLITDSLAEVLVCNADQIDISLDGYDEESVSRIRGEGVFGKVIQTIIKIQKLGFDHISLSTVLTKENLDNIGKFKQLCKKYKVKELLRVLSPGGRAHDHYEEFNSPAEDIAPDCQNIKEYSFKCTCAKVNSEISIDENGNIYPCVLLQESDYRIGKVQDLLNHSWNKNGFLSPMVDSIKECCDCDIRYFCASNCIGLDIAIFYDEKIRKYHCEKSKKIYACVWD